MLTSKVKEIMEKQGMTIRAMVERTGLADVTILRARKNQIAQCRLSTLETIARCLNCRIKDLFEED
jgi:DNA-binding Xre family transcriptional regulator